MVIVSSEKRFCVASETKVSESTKGMAISKAEAEMYSNRRRILT